MKGETKSVSNLIGKCLLCLALVLTSFAPTIAEASSGQKSATIIELKGDVFVTKGGGKREIKAFKGMGLTQGDTLRTGKGAYARIEFDQHNAVSLAQLTTITLAELAEQQGINSTKVKQSSGGLWNKVKRSVGAGDTYQVETPTSIMGVRGTMFLTQFDKGRTSLSVLDGIVGVGSARSSSQTGGTEDEQQITHYEDYQDTGTLLLPGSVQHFDPSRLDDADMDLVIDLLSDLLDEAESREQEASEILSSMSPEPDPELTEKMLTELHIAAYLNDLADLIFTRSTARGEEFEEKLQEREQSREQVEQRLRQQQERQQEMWEQAEEVRRQAGLGEQESELEQQIQERRRLIEEQRQQQRDQEQDTQQPGTGGGGGGGSDGGSSPIPSPGQTEGKVFLAVDGNQLSVVIDEIAEGIAISGVQIHLDVGAKQKIEDWVSEDYITVESGLFADMEQVAEHLKGIEHPQIADELIYAQVLFGEDVESGYVLNNGDKITFIDNSDQPLYFQPDSVNLLDVLFIKTNGEEVNLEIGETIVIVQGVD